MANYTMEIRQMVDNPLIGLFTFDYDFYSDNIQDKEEFEKLFSQWYYYREIGFETPEHFKVRLQSKLNLIMPYYRQLALTEWDNVKTTEQMMTSKNLIETTEHSQELSGVDKSDTHGTNSSSSHDTSIVEQTTSGTSSNTQNQTLKQSNLSDGVSQSSLSDGYLTNSGQTNTQTEQTDSQTVSSSNENNGNTQATITQYSSTNRGQTLTESTTFTSKGDIGIQTPAYAITEWRKVLININQMIIDECNDLFMKIY